MDITTASPPAQAPALYTLPDILARARCSKSHLYNMLARGQFPQPAVRCGPRFTRWLASDVHAWLANPSEWMAANRASCA